MNIVFFCKRYYTNKDLIDDRFGRLFHLPVELAKLGNTVTVLALDYRNHNGGAECIEGVAFKTLPCKFRDIPSLMLSITGSISSYRPDCIVASGDSYIGFVASRISQKLGVKFVFDVYDYYPAFAGNCIPGMKGMFRSAVNRADLITVASGALKRALAGKNKNIVVLENGVDPYVFRPYSKSVARARLGIVTDVTFVGYFGSITPTRGPLLIEACKLLRKSGVDLRVLLAGPASSVDLDFPWILYRGEVNQKEVPYLIAACDVVTLPYANNEFNNHCGACKIAEYIYCERPIVATDVSDHQQVFAGVPRIVCDAQAKALAIAIRAQLLEPELVVKDKLSKWSAIAERFRENI